MSQLSEFLQYQIQLKNVNNDILPQSNQQQKKKKVKQPSKPNQKWKTQKKKVDDRYKFFTLPSEFPTAKDRDTWRMIKFKSFFQNLNQKNSFL